MSDLKTPLSVIRRTRLGVNPTSRTSDVSSKEQVSEDLKRRIEDFLKMMVEDSADIKISVIQGERTTIFSISCGRHNIAKILGRKGKTIDAIRTLVASITGRYGFRAIVEVPYFPNE
ncbi:KH domain-containing protein [Bdellovibrio sp.]|uniref:KH domain-containing protein n=1 Tax=Bdellovibrio sp. TaxID=28201 RepID=UPI0039E4AA43